MMLPTRLLRFLADPQECVRQALDLRYLGEVAQEAEAEAEEFVAADEEEEEEEEDEQADEEEEDEIEYLDDADVDVDEVRPHQRMKGLGWLQKVCASTLVGASSISIGTMRCVFLYPSTGTS